ncbi:DNA mismatch repair protein MutS [Lacticigenium naphthae]|uniref:DNA mismatch repair protein MutS n=1 Tax=Lacticigenium naphthae TaxID=515351 RepID=UPI000423239C|nr:DNA mismatch repair protein MutS [Lacticigenium naphthae]
MPQKTKMTPMMEQYHSIKSNYTDAFLFYRLGDFYEMFHEDAIKASKILELTLTSRNKNADEPIPMCGVPYHSAQQHIDTLIEKGYKVAICEQVEDPKEAKGMVKREVVQLITPGTVIESKNMKAKENNYLSAIYIDESYHLAYADLSTGECKVTSLNSKEDLLNELFSIHSKEIVFPEGEYLELQNEIEKNLGLYISTYTSKKSEAELDKHIPVDFPIAQQTALSHLVGYLYETQMRSLDHLQEAENYEAAHFMQMGKAAKRNLELTESLRDGSRKGTLLWLLDETKTAMGGRLLKKWINQPLIQKKEIEERLDTVASLLNHFFERIELVDHLENVYDLERLAGRIAFGNVNGRELKQLNYSLNEIPIIKETISLMNDEIWEKKLGKLVSVRHISTLIEGAIMDEPPQSITDGELIKDGFNSKLDEYRDAMRNGKKWIAELEKKERDKTGIRNLKIGFNKVFGYYIEITKSHLQKLPEGTYDRKQTLTNAERFITPELKEKESLILEAEEKSKALEYSLFLEIREEVKKELEAIQSLAKVIAEIDVLQSFASIAEQYHYTRPEFHSTNEEIEIKDGRHPVVEKVLGEQSYVPNDVLFNQDVDILLITGPNMSGKSTYMRQLALTVVMAQMGSFVPAKKASLPLFDKIFTRIGAMDDLIGGQSTFMVEMMEANLALTQATRKSLLLFDEIGRGTATFDGMALAEAIIEYVHENIGAKTLFSTHYHELTELETRLNRLKNIHVGAIEEDGNLVFLHKMMEGSADKSYGIQVAKLAGLPISLLSRAEQVLSVLENKNKIKEMDTEYEEISRSEKETLKENQLSLFSAQNPNEETVLNEIKDISLINLTPLEALNTINRLQGKLNEDGGRV